MRTGPAEFLAAAGEIGARLCRNAIWSGKRSNWIGPSMEFVEDNWRPVHRACGGSLYNGTSGVALFLERLFGFTGVAEYRRTAQAAFEQALSRVVDIPPNCRAGFYSGVTGVAYTGFALGRAEDAMALLKPLLDENIADHDLDVVSGSAGAIPALLALRRATGREFLLDLARRHGEHLLATARGDSEAWSWNTLRLAAGRDLTGFSHGTSGIAWALLELFAATGDARYRDAARRALGYERRWFNPEFGNWPDFRTSNEANPPGSAAPSYGIAWCHGAPGIGLARLRAYEILREPWCREDAEIALRTTAPFLREPALRSHNYSLCHGVAGNAELALMAGTVLADDAYVKMAGEVGWYGIEAYRKQRAPWPCGVSGAGEAPNLMLGLAGIGYFYLRLYDPAAIPSVLLYAPPDAA